jgi:polyisoprenoid-binding protein YceI
MFRREIATTAAVVLSTAFSASASTWTIDPAHTSVQFAVRHLMISSVKGTLGKVSGVVTIDEGDITKSTVEATVDAAGIDTREPKRDEHLRNPDFLDVARFPTITFKSTQVRKILDDEYEVAGNLTIRGVTKPVTLYVRGTPAELNDPFGNVKLGGVVNAKLNRQDFGMSWNKALDAGGVVMGNEVGVTIDVELIKKTGPAKP